MIRIDGTRERFANVQIYKYVDRRGDAQLGVVEGDARSLTPLDTSQGQYRTLTDILEADDRPTVVELLANRSAAALDVDRLTLLPPIDDHEVWAAGVTYLRSRTARMEESPTAADCYDRVYEAPRPELFLKATSHRVVGSGAEVRVRADSNWSVPEPELGLVLNSRLDVVGYTAGNDMSARDIEGENPLYLPQAKVYDACCAIGPCVTLADALPAPQSVGIRLSVERGGEQIFAGETSAKNMARRFDDLVGYLARDNTFPAGVVLLTGTGIVPPDEFALEAGDVVRITIEDIGTLENTVVKD